MDNVLEEKLLSHEKNESFNIEIISKQNTLVKALLTVDKTNQQFILILNDNNITIPIRFIDVLGLVRESLNDDKSINRSTELIKLLAKGEKILASLNMYQNIKRKACSLIGLLCCKCYYTIEERKLRVNANFNI
jgi:hypothetical protein